MMKTPSFDFIDISVDSVNKFKEELCGDHVEITENDVSKIVVLSDGLGSGVKANILSTLTSKIASTMLQKGLDIIDVLETLEKTLPTCQVRKLAYSTFTIVQIFNDGRVVIIEFDNPKVVYIRNDAILELDVEDIKFKDKTIHKYTTNYKNGDLISIFSDGVIHTGIGKHIYLGWQYEEVVKVITTKNRKEKTAKAVSQSIIDICKTFSDQEPGDDTTCVVIKIRDIEPVTLFAGPPEDQNKDKEIVQDLMHAPGKKVVCGGTAANICSRELDKAIETNIDELDFDIPPYAKIEGLDLVTEGVITLNYTIKLMNQYIDRTIDPNVLKKNNGGVLLFKLLMSQCTHLNILIGNNNNPAHQNPYFPSELSYKWIAVKELADTMEKLNKKVTITTY